MGYSRAYSLSLAPQLIYSRSNLLPALVSSKVYRQLEFLAVGSWWLYGTDNVKIAEETKPPRNRLQRIPGGREDVFADKSIDLRSTRSLMKFLKLAADTDTHVSILEKWGCKPFSEYLESDLRIPPTLQAPLIALTSSPSTPALTSYAIPRIHRHLTSIGMFGPGFGAVIPKWGGLAEIAQVACRAQAVGGGVYVLNRGLDTIGILNRQGSSGEDNTSKVDAFSVGLEGGEEIKTRWLVGSSWDLPWHDDQGQLAQSIGRYSVARSITIVGGLLLQLFPPPAEGTPPPAGAIVVCPTGTLDIQSGEAPSNDHQPPIYLMVHSSDTGECPTGQCKSLLLLDDRYDLS